MPGTENEIRKCQRSPVAPPCLCLRVPLHPLPPSPRGPALWWCWWPPGTAVYRSSCEHYNSWQSSLESRAQPHGTSITPGAVSVNHTTRDHPSGQAVRSPFLWCPLPVLFLTLFPPPCRLFSLSTWRCSGHTQTQETPGLGNHPRFPFLCEKKTAGAQPHSSNQTQLGSFPK